MKKILMISGDRAIARGDKGAFFNTLSELHKYFDRVDVISPRSGMAREVRVFDNTSVYPSPFSMVFQVFWIVIKGYILYKKNGYDAMIVHEYPPFYNGIGSAILSIITGLPYLLEIHHIPGHPRYANPKELFYVFLMRYFIFLDTYFATKVRVVNKQETPKFLIETGVNRKKLIYCPSFYINYDIFKPRPDIEKYYDFVFAARLEPNKGILNLIDAIDIIRNKKPDVRLLIIGKGSLDEALRAKIKERNLENNIIFSGWLAGLEDVAKAYCSAKIFVNPSFNEGGPRVLIEAMACGLPVISTPVGIAPDLVKEGVNGWITDWISDKMAETMLRALNNNIKPPKFFVEDFEYNKAIKNYAEVIDSIK